MSDESPGSTDIPDLGMRCGDADCEHGTHAFNDPHRDYQRKGRGRHFLEAGVCKACGADVVAWDRVHRRDIEDIEHTFASLRKESIREEFWQRPLNDASTVQFEQLGMQGIEALVRPTLLRILGHEPKSGWAFQQVPTADTNITSALEYAQHAVAACCRRCAWHWHDVPQDGDIQPRQLQYLGDLVIAFIRRRWSAKYE